MKIKWSFISAMMAILLVLSACGAKESSTENTDVDDTEDTPVSEVEEEDTTEGSLVEADQEDATEDEEDEESIDTPSKDSEVTTPPATEDPQPDSKVNSDDQDYSMNLLANYELTSEEPGRDILYSTDDDSHFMRIETMENEDGNYDYLKDNMIVVLQASSNGETPVELTEDKSLPAGDSITNAVSYTVNTETGQVTGILFERGNLIVRLTIFDSMNADYFVDFLKMGETISPK